MKNDYYESPKPSWLTKQFWRAAGADKYLLERSTYSDQIKYFCLGGIVVATGVMAALAGGYAFYTIFEPKNMDLTGRIFTNEMVAQGISNKDLIHWPTVFSSCLFGVIWGWIIFNIDRFIVTSTGKGDGTEAITKQEFKGAIPRIIMGMIIAVTISKPLEIRMFQSEIDAAIYELQQDEQKILQVKIDAQYDNLIQTEKNKLEKLELEIREKEDRYVDLENTFNLETRGDRGDRGYGPEAKKIEEQMKRMDKEIQLIRSNNQSLIDSSAASVKKHEAERNKKYDEARAQVSAMGGLALRLKLAHQEAGWVISLFITLLFMVIELTPIFFKMMLIKGPYDYMDENIKELSRAELGIEIEYNFYQDGEGVEKHKVTNHAAEIKRKERLAILKAQDEMNQKIIEEWKKRELKRIEDNPDDFISNG